MISSFRYRNCVYTVFLIHAELRYVFVTASQLAWTFNGTYVLFSGRLYHVRRAEGAVVQWLKTELRRRRRGDRSGGRRLEEHESKAEMLSRFRRDLGETAHSRHVTSTARNAHATPTSHHNRVFNFCWTHGHARRFLEPYTCCHGASLFRWSQ